MTQPEGDVRYTRSGFEFRIVAVEDVTAGHDDATWWRGCPHCPMSVQGGEAGVAAHVARVHGNDLRIGI
jgi:hypothetical protein